MHKQNNNRQSIAPTRRFVFNYGNVNKGGQYHQFNLNQAGVTPVPTTNEINLSNQNRSVLFAAGYDAGFDNVYDWYTVFNGAILPAERNASDTNGNDQIGPADIGRQRLPILIDAAGVTGEVYKKISNNTLKIPNSGITYIERMGVFQPVNSDAGATTFSVSLWNNGAETTIPQTSWNVDNFGLGARNPSGKTIDWTQLQTLVLEVNNHDHGMMRIGFLIENTIFFAHDIESNNTVGELPFGSLNLPTYDQTSRTSSISVIRDIGFFDGQNGIVFRATTDTTATPAAILEYYDHTAVAYSVGDGIKKSKKPFNSDMEENYLEATTSPGTFLMAIRPTETLSGVSNKTVFSVDSVNITTRTPNLDDEAIVEIWWNPTIADGDWENVSSYSGLEESFNATVFSMPSTSIKLGAKKIKGNQSLEINMHDILVDYENAFSIKSTTFNALPILNVERGTIMLIARSMPLNSGSDPFYVSASISGGEVA